VSKCEWVFFSEHSVYCVDEDVKPCSFLTYMKLWKAQVPYS